MEDGDASDAAMETSGIDGGAARRLCRAHLASYFAAAVMMPYERFLQAAESLRYDVEILSRRFGASFEQVCHRLTTLHRPGARGVPFFMRSEEHTSELQSLMRISYAVFCLKKKHTTT